MRNVALIGGVVQLPHIQKAFRNVHIKLSSVTNNARREGNLFRGCLSVVDEETVRDGNLIDVSRRRRVFSSNDKYFCQVLRNLNLGLIFGWKRLLKISSQNAQAVLGKGVGTGVRIVRTPNNHSLSPGFQLAFGIESNILIENKRIECCHLMIYPEDSVVCG